MDKLYFYTCVFLAIILPHTMVEGTGIMAMIALQAALIAVGYIGSKTIDKTYQ